MIALWIKAGVAYCSFFSLSPGELIQHFVIDPLFFFLFVHDDPSGYSVFFVCNYYIIASAVKQSVFRVPKCHPELVEGFPFFKKGIDL